jgi:hypothetical protein
MTLSVGKVAKAGARVERRHDATGDRFLDADHRITHADPPPRPRVLLVRRRDALDLDRHPEPARVERALVLAPVRELGDGFERHQRDRPDVERVARAVRARESHLVAGVRAHRLAEVAADDVRGHRATVEVDLEGLAVGLSRAGHDDAVGEPELERVGGLVVDGSDRRIGALVAPENRLPNPSTKKNRRSPAAPRSSSRMRSGWCSAVDLTGVTLKRATVGTRDTLPTRSDGGHVVPSGSMEARRAEAEESARPPMATPARLHEDPAELAFLVGEWSGTGEGVWPPGEPFDYAEDVTFEFVGDPFLSYAQRSWSLDDGSPIHLERGFLRPAGPASSSSSSPIRSGSPRSRSGPWTMA